MSSSIPIRGEIVGSSGSGATSTGLTSFVFGAFNSLSSSVIDSALTLSNTRRPPVTEAVPSFANVAWAVGDVAVSVLPSKFADLGSTFVASRLIPPAR